MRVQQVDERDSSWEIDSPRFRVYFFEGRAPDYGSRVDTYDVEDADVLQVVEWAQRRAGDAHLYAVALVGERDGRRGLTWLLGVDFNGGPSPSTEAMVERKGRTVVMRSTAR